MPTMEKTTVKIAAATRRSAPAGSIDERAVERTAGPIVDRALDGIDSIFLRPTIPSRYEILSEVGRGGMGIVYKVRDIDTQEILALKILKPEVAGDPAMREGLRKEVCLARKVTHKNVCRMHEFNRFESTACVSMEFVDGESLLSKLRTEGALAPGEVVEIARQICAGLGEAHAQGIVHRDLKPANIMISENQTVKVMDFGIARQAHETGQTTSMLAGTPAYMAPEQVESKPLSSRTDIYALGLLLYEMTTGQPAFSGDNAVSLALMHLRQTPTRPTKLLPTIPSRLEAAILKCLEKNPAKRFGSAEELSAALDGSLLPTTVQALSETVLQPAKVAVTNGARATASRLDLLAAKIETVARRANDALPPKLREWSDTLFGQRYLSRPVRTAQVALVFGATLLSTSAGFALVTRLQMHAANGSMPGTSLFAAMTPTSFAAAFGAKEFDFRAMNDVVSANEAAAAVPAASVPIAKIATISSVMPKPASSKRKTDWRLLTPGAQPVQANLLAPSNPDAAFAEAVRTSPLPAESAAYSPAMLSLLTPTPPEAEQDGAELKPGVSDTYLEVGTFNDGSWADEAVSRLSEMGFHAICVHKKQLWAQSYRVEVGPFETLQNMESAEQQLTAKGFKPHAVK
jgi:predicted Ser/Thr protein kinase